MANARQIQCLLCEPGTTYGSCRSLGSHVSRSHAELFDKVDLAPKVRTYFCNVCKELKTSRLYKLMNHIYLQHLDKCVAKRREDSIIVRGDNIETNNGLINNDTYKRPQRLSLMQRGIKGHYVSYSRDSFGCELCHFTDVSEQKMVAHSKRHMNSVNGFRCRKCGFASVGYEEVKKHNNEHHAGDAINLKDCPWCNYKHISLKACKQHRLRHTVKSSKVDNIICKVCNYNVENMRVMKYHIKNNHSVAEQNAAAAAPVPAPAHPPVRMTISLNNQNAAAAASGATDGDAEVTSSSKNSGGGASGSGSVGGHSPVVGSAAGGHSPLAGGAESCNRSRHNSTCSRQSSVGGGAPPDTTASGVGCTESVLYGCPFCDIKSNSAAMLYNHVLWGHVNDMGLNPVDEIKRQQAINQLLASDPGLAASVANSSASPPAEAAAPVYFSGSGQPEPAIINLPGEGSSMHMIDPQLTHVSPVFVRADAEVAGDVGAGNAAALYGEVGGQVVEQQHMAAPPSDDVAAVNARYGGTSAAAMASHTSPTTASQQQMDTSSEEGPAMMASATASATPNTPTHTPLTSASSGFPRL